jgi:uncharacterized Rossmann fold enzyme
MKFNLGSLHDLKAVGGSMSRAVDRRLIEVQDRVRDHFGWAYSDDLQSARALMEACEAHPRALELGWDTQGREAMLGGLQELLLNAPHVVLIGAAVQPSDLERQWPEGTVFVAADGAVGACFDIVEPTCVVSDLDGGIHLEEAIRRRIPLIIHAHGDNMDTWQRFLKHWTDGPAPRLLFTHQTHENIRGSHNVGGFTDGDRAVCFVSWMGVSNDRMELVGYATTHVGEWSGTTNVERKLAKLEWMAEVLDLILPDWRERGRTYA